MNILSTLISVSLFVNIGTYVAPEVQVAGSTPEIILVQEASASEIVPPSPDLTTKEGIISYIKSKDWPADVAIAIMMAESTGNPSAYNPEAHRGCNGSFGLMQVACLHVDDPSTLFDVETNIDTAYAIYQRQGFRPWTTYTSGKYLKYLKV